MSKAEHFTPMARKLLGWDLIHKRSSKTACGLDSQNHSTTDIINNVTCGNCLKSSEMKLFKRGSDND